MESQADYENFIEYGIKVYAKIRRVQYPTMPTDRDIVTNIVYDALLMTAETFDPSFGADPKSHFYNKIKGEMFKWLSRRMTENKHAATLDEGGELMFERDKEGARVAVVATREEEDVLRVLEKDDSVRRKIAANRMAMGELPFEHQAVLEMAVEHDSIQTAAEVLGIDVDEFRLRRDKALSLLLKKVIRSKHLHEDEREEVKRQYHLI